MVNTTTMVATPDTLTLADDDLYAQIRFFAAQRYERASVTWYRVYFTEFIGNFASLCISVLAVFKFFMYSV